MRLCLHVGRLFGNLVFNEINFIPDKEGIDRINTSAVVPAAGLVLIK